LPEILHIIPRLTPGGAGRSLVELIKRVRSRDDRIDRVIALAPSDRTIARQLRAFGVEVTTSADPGFVGSAIGASDLVVLHFWNSPEMFALMSRPWPAARVLLWATVFGAHAPQILSAPVLRFADLIAFTTPSSAEVPGIAGALAGPLPVAWTTLPAISDFARVEAVVPRAHEGFTVGYIGTVDYAKMHPDFVALHAAIAIPGLRVVVCGEGQAVDDIRRRAQAMGRADLFDLRGQVEDIGSVLAGLDVFGYPLCADTYATTERSIQEAMLCRLPVVVFPHGGVRDAVVDGETGVVVADGAAYVRAIERLHRDPAERARLGRNAAAVVRERFAPQDLVDRVVDHCAVLLDGPRRQRAPLDRGHAVAEATPGAALFLVSLAHAAVRFETSIADDDIAAVLAADRAIADASPVLVNAGGGGIFHYRASFPDDPWLRLWSGLVLERQGRFAIAIGEYRRAIELGCAHWRVQAYLCRAARRLRSPMIAESALQAALRLGGLDAVGRVLADPA